MFILELFFDLLLHFDYTGCLIAMFFSSSTNLPTSGPRKNCCPMDLRHLVCDKTDCQRGVVIQRAWVQIATKKLYRFIEYTLLRDLPAMQV